MKQWEEKIEKRTVTWLVLSIIGALLLAWLLAMGLFGLRVATAGLVGAGEARIQIQSAGSRIAAYNSFFNMCASIQANEGQIDELTTATNAATTPFEKERLSISLASVKAIRHGAIAQYNANARKDYTVGQFRDSDLPYQLVDSDYAPGGRKTSCGAD